MVQKITLKRDVLPLTLKDNYLHIEIMVSRTRQSLVKKLPDNSERNREFRFL